MKELTDKEIQEKLEKDSIGRNEQLMVLIKLLNSFNENRVLLLNGEWGSGKTVFIKQLKLLNENNDINFNDQVLKNGNDAISEFKTKYSVYYFNSWENDFLKDPLQALLYRLIVDFYSGTFSSLGDKAMSKVKLTNLVKKLTKDTVSIDEKTKKEELVKEIKEIVDRGQLVNDFLDEYVIKNDNRSLFIIDELDRCKPSFAVELLEIIKHYFHHKNITFIITANVNQLNHTIKKYYGSGFDGVKYLNRFFDYSFKLKNVDTKQYLESQLGWVRNNYYKNAIPFDTVDYLKMSMREIGSYAMSLDLIRGYMGDHHYLYNEMLAAFNKVALVPLALGLKIVSDVKYKDFINGKGQTIIEDFYQFSEYFADLSENTHSDYSRMASADRTNSAIKMYDKLFNLDNSDHTIKAIKEEFDDDLNLISLYIDIDGSEGNYE